MLTTIRHKDTGDLVKVAQYLTGYAERGKASGKYDADFVAHVCAWQKKHNLTPDGVFGPKSWKKAAEIAPLCTTSKNNKSRYVCALQILLDGDMNVDGIFGAKTKQKVAAFQAAANLTTDGKCGTNTWTALITGERLEATDGVKPNMGYNQPIDYKQGDPRWGSKMYSSTGNKKQTMANSGCGPTAMADVVATLKDPSIDPYTLALQSVADGHRSATGGTAWSFFPFIMEKFNFSKMVQTDSFTALQACLDNGGYVVCSMGPGYWTTGGHFICVWKYDEKYVYANDPASKTRKKQKIADFKKQHKEYFCFYA